MLGGRHRKAATTKNKKAKTRQNKSYKALKGVIQLVKFWVCFLEIISSSPTNLRVTGNFHNH
jgi:hypothetical protein